MFPATGGRLPIHFDPIRAHRSYGVPDRYEFVPNRTADYLNVFDLAAGRGVKRIQVAGRPDVTATTIDGRFLYVAGEHLTAIDLQTLTIMGTFSGNGINAHYALNLFPAGRRMFLFNYDGSIAILRHADDPRRLAVEKVLVVNQPAEPDAAIGGKGHFSADGRRYINANWHTDSVFGVDLEQGYRVTTLVPTGFSRPDDLVMAADGRKGYAASYGRAPDLSAVHVFDLETGCVIKTLRVGRNPAGLTMSPDGRYVYVTNVADGSVSAIDTQGDEVLFTASAAHEYRAAGITGDYLDIEGVTVSADGRTLYAYAVNYGALIVFEGLSPSGVQCARFISGEI
jgi:YVTN family beta-propeller protein